MVFKPSVNFSLFLNLLVQLCAKVKLLTINLVKLSKTVVYSIIYKKYLNYLFPGGIVFLNSRKNNRTQNRLRTGNFLAE